MLEFAFRKLVIFAAIVTSGFFVFQSPASAATAEQKVHKVRWVLAHEPIDLFKKAADHFATQISARTGGKVQVEVLTLREYADRYNKGVVPHPSQLVEMMQTGKVEMSQMYTTTLGQINRDMYALDLPFLFRDHDHAQNVLEGKIGQNLLAGLAKTSEVRGLAFTYSGGYRVIPAKQAVRRIEDFKGLKIRTSSSPVAQETFRALGAEPVPMDLEQIGDATKSGQIQGAESTYPRFYSMKQNEYSKVLNDTKHSLFLTSIIISSSFWNSIDADLQRQMSEMATESARLERTDSIRDADVTKNKCVQDGIPVVDLSAAEQSRFKVATKGVYKKFEPTFSPGLVSSIQKSP